MSYQSHEAVQLIDEFIESYRMMERPDHGLSFRVIVPREFADLWMDCLGRLVVGPDGLPELKAQSSDSAGQREHVDTSSAGQGTLRMVDSCVDQLSYHEVADGGLEIDLGVPEQFASLWICSLDGLYIDAERVPFMRLNGRPEDYGSIEF